MVTEGVSEPAALRKMLKPLAEKRRRERMNRSLEELRVLLLERTRHQTLQNRKVEKAEILELAVRYLQEWGAPAGRGADPAGDPDPLHHRYRLGFRECLLRLSAFVRAAPPGPLLDALRLYLAASGRHGPPEPSPRLQPGPPPPPASPRPPWGRRAAPGPRAPETPQRHTEGAGAAWKGDPPPPPVWRPWP